MHAKPQQGAGRSDQSSRAAQATLEDYPPFEILPEPLLHLSSAQKGLA